MAKTAKPNIRSVRLSLKKNVKGKIIVSAVEDDGTSHLNLSFFQPRDFEWNEKKVLLYLENGKAVKITTETGELLAAARIVNTNALIQTDDSYTPEKSFLPAFVKKLLPDDIDNFHLKLNRAARYDSTDSKFKHHSTDEKGGKTPYSVKANFGFFDNTILAAVSFRVKKAAESLGLHIKSLCLISPQNEFNRMIVGLGTESVYENGMTLHHIYGIPFIPGSAVKGVTRNYIVTERFDGNEKKALQDPLFVYLFGTGGNADEEGGARGKAYFFDAFPTDVPRIEPDVMNNHYQDYYEKKTPPADWLSPNPVFFLTVKDGKFCFHVGVSGNRTWQPSTLFDVPGKAIFNVQSTTLDILAAWVMAALANHGIGAKTAVGYGRMK